jgi:hypothetical protein
VSIGYIFFTFWYVVQKENLATLPLFISSSNFTHLLYEQTCFGSFVDANEKVADLEVGTMEISGATYARRSMFEKRENFFQLISTLFCEVKRGLVHR